MRYTIVKHDSLEALVPHINALIAEGWVLAGGCSMCDVSSRWQSERHYAQAMVHPDLSPLPTFPAPSAVS